METVKIYHNNRCSKSREACSLLDKKKIKAEVIEYLKTPPSEKDIKSLLKMLGIKAEELIRKKEPIFIEKYAGKKLTETQCIKAMVQHPILIERPIVVKDNKAVIARPAEKLLELLK